MWKIQWCNQNYNRHHPWNQEDPPWIRKGSWKMTRSNFEVQRSVKYQFVYTLWNKFNGVVKITYGHLPWSKEDPPLNDDQILFFELQISEIYQFVGTLGDKSDGVSKITYVHDTWCQKDTPWIRKGFWRINRSYFVNFWATAKCHKSICMYFVRQFQWCNQITYGHNPWMAH